jgi:hypothetical protein
MTNTQAKEIKLPYSGDVVKMKERVTWGEKMEIQKAFMGDKEVSTSGNIGGFKYSDLLDGVKSTLSIVLVEVERKDGTKITDIEKWMDEVDGEDGELLMTEAMEYFSQSQKKTLQKEK